MQYSQFEAPHKSCVIGVLCIERENIEPHSLTVGVDWLSSSIRGARRRSSLLLSQLQKKYLQLLVRLFCGTVLLCIASGMVAKEQRGSFSLRCIKFGVLHPLETRLITSRKGCKTSLTLQLVSCSRKRRGYKICGSKLRVKPQELSGKNMRQYQKNH